MQLALREIQKFQIKIRDKYKNFKNAIGLWEKYQTFKMKMQFAFERNKKLFKMKMQLAYDRNWAEVGRPA